MDIVAPKDGTILELLLVHFNTATPTRVRKMLKHGMVRIGGIPVLRADHRVKAGESIVYLHKQGQKKSVEPPFPVLFEDEHLLAVEKPPGILTYGEKNSGGTSLYKVCLDFVRAKSNGKQRIYVVHRLDREVSGVVLFAKSAKVQQQVKDKWKGARKRYVALVEGRPPEESGTIRSWLKEEVEGQVFKVRSVDDPKGARLAVTRYRVLKTVKARTLLEIELDTGRKNQVRVHLSELGCPVVGDRRHGAEAAVIRRVRLHAVYLATVHPVSEKPLVIESPMPTGFLSVGNRDEDYK